MTIEEVKQKKKDLENQIATLLRDFRDQTGIHIHEIYLETTSVGSNVVGITVKAEILL